MTAILVNCIEGFSASSRKDSITISYLVKKQIKEFVTKYPKQMVMFHAVYSNRVSAIDDSIRFIKNNSYYGIDNTSLFLVGKSMGGAKTWWLLKDRWKDIKNFGKIYVLTIDPHGSIVGDSSVGPYGKNKVLPYSKKWRKKQYRESALCLVNMYQHSSWPHGAEFNGASNIEFDKGADHWNITNHKSRHSKITCQQILNGLEWLR